MDKAKRKAIIAGNWKMNKTASEAAVLVDELVPAVQDAGCEVVICTRIPIWSPLWKRPRAPTSMWVLRMFTSRSPALSPARSALTCW